MRSRFVIWFKGLVGLGLILLLWSLWASAQGSGGNAVVEFSQASFTVIENQRAALITARRTGNTNADVSVDFSTADDIAVAGKDYTAVREQVRFIPGQTVQKVSVPVANDFEVTGDRTVKLALSNPSPGAVLGEQSTARLTIIEDDSRRTAWMTFGLERVEGLSRTAFDIPLYQYLASLLYVLLAFYAAKLFDYVIHTQLKRWTQRTKTTLDDILLELLRGPIKVVLFVILLHVGLRIFSWPDWFGGLLSKALKIVVACSLTYLALKLADLAVNYWRQRATAAAKPFNDQLLPIFRNSLKVFVVIVAILVTLQNLGVEITSLIASLSIGGLALSLAAQDTVANMFGAVSVLMDKPFQVGDRIKVENVDGVVEAIGLRSTRVRSLDGHVATVPNKTMGNATIVNVTLRPTIKTEMNIGLTYDTSTEKLRRALAILEEIYRGSPMTGDLLISFNKFADSALNILVVHFWTSTDYKAYLAGMQEFNLAIKERFDREGISFAFPSQTLYLKQDSEWRWSGAGPG